MQEYTRNERLMGSAFKLGIVLANETEAQYWLQQGVDEIQRLEKMLSEFLPEAITTKINSLKATEELVIPTECFSLLQRCQNLSQLSDGDFDISVSPLKRLYNFKNEHFEMPPRKNIKATLDKVGYKKIVLNEQRNSISFTNDDMKISFAAIGKGYAADMVKKMWQQNGINNGYINASGDLCAFGNNAKGEPWKVAIANPDVPDKMLLYIPMNNAAVATSGDGEQHFLYKGKRFSHNINPDTGLPLSGIKSVTVVSSSAELSDALATAVYVKGSADGVNFVNQLPQTHCIIIDEQNQIHISQDLIYEKLPS